MELWKGIITYELCKITILSVIFHNYKLEVKYIFTDRVNSIKVSFVPISMVDKYENFTIDT